MKTLTKLGTTALAGGFALAFSTGIVLAGHHEQKDGMRDGHAGHGAKMFEMMDTNKDGKITKDEMQAHHDARKSAADADGDGKVSKDEFKAQMQKKHDKHVERMFSRMDQNGDGYLTEEDRGDKPHRGERMFEKLDKDGDGAISMEEAKKMKRHHKGHHDGHHGKCDND